MFLKVVTFIFLDFPFNIFLDFLFHSVYHLVICIHVINQLNDILIQLDELAFG
jgi:hypothetical protein